MKIVFFGTPQFAIPTLEALLKNDRFEVLGVVTQPDKKRGRGNQLVPSPVKVIAQNYHLPVWQPAKIKKDSTIIETLKNLQADVFVVIAYGQILSQEILNLPKYGCINVHGSILPKYRGAAPIQRCLVNGETQTGITTMLMDVGMDTGAILLTSYLDINILMNAHKLAIELSQIGANLLIQTLEKLEDIQAIPQNNDRATYAPMIEKIDYQLNWHHNTWELHNQIRGLYPDCFTTFRQEKLKVMSTVPLGESYWSLLPPAYQKIQNQWSEIGNLSANSGEIIKIIKGLGAIVKTCDGYLLLNQLQLPGKKPQSGWDFANGTRLMVGEKLGV